MRASVSEILFSMQSENLQDIRQQMSHEQALASRQRELKTIRSKEGHEKAEWATDRARTALQKLGYSVNVPGNICQNGPDLHFGRSAGEGFTCEVKLAMLIKRAWRVNRVTRKKDDYIAIVFPSGYVHFDEMKTHLKLCNKSGDRHLTALGRLFE